jgi:hypothetical protein
MVQALAIPHNHKDDRPGRPTWGVGSLGVGGGGEDLEW